MLAKMGKGELVSVETIAKIRLTLNCGLDDIADLSPDWTRED